MFFLRAATLTFPIRVHTSDTILELARFMGRMRMRSIRVAQLIVESFYFPDAAMFYDVREGTHAKFSGVKNPNLFL